MLAAAPAPAPAPAGEGEEPPASPEKAPLPPYVQSRLRVLTAPGVDKPVPPPPPRCGLADLRRCRQRTEAVRPLSVTHRPLQRSDLPQAWPACRMFVVG